MIDTRNRAMENPKKSEQEEFDEDGSSMSAGMDELKAMNDEDMLEELKGFETP